MVFIQIIAPPEGSRHKPLTDQLDRLGLEYTLVPAHMLTEIPEGYDMQRAIAYNGWPLTPGEIGCAMSHREAQTILAESGETWGLILEDDARITDSNGFLEFLKCMTTRLSTQSKEVLTLFSGPTLAASWSDGGTLSCATRPWTTVAYALNSQAALSLAQANGDLAQVADWPVCSEVQFHIWPKSLISHGDDTAQSLIMGRYDTPLRGANGLGSRTFSRLAHRVSLYAGIHYFRFRRYFPSLSEYFAIVLERRVAMLTERFLYHSKVRALWGYSRFPGHSS